MRALLLIIFCFVSVVLKSQVTYIPTNPVEYFRIISSTTQNIGDSGVVFRQYTNQSADSVRTENADTAVYNRLYTNSSADSVRTENSDTASANRVYTNLSIDTVQGQLADTTARLLDSISGLNQDILDLLDSVSNINDVIEDYTYFYFKDSSIYFPNVNTTFRQFTNDNDTIFVIGYDAVTTIIGGDTVVYGQSGKCEHFFEATMTVSANDDMEFDIYNVTDDVVINVDEITSSGSGNFSKVSFTGLDENADAGDKIIIRYRAVSGTLNVDFLKATWKTQLKSK